MPSRLELQPPPDALTASAHASFRTTHWSLVVHAADTGDAQSFAALERLCQAYWPPVHAFIRRRGHTPQDAMDLTQGFFARMLEKEWLQAADIRKGRFRTFLLTAVTRFLANSHQHASAQKRGAGQVLLSIDALEEETGWTPKGLTGETPEDAYDRRWAERLLDRVMDRLRGEFDGGGRTGRFEALKRFLTEDRGETSYGAVAAQLGVSPSAVKSGIHRMRQRYGELVREEIAETVDSPDDVEAELRHLMSVMGG